ncbi:MAG TPA: HAD-IA family hydrolase, partial [Clostridiaceae bacterium]|nr:HAD-IA family hydrolase [Clostridiaceae bacterium]
RLLPLKPHPRSTLKLLKDMHAEPSRSFFVGDSDVDILTGQTAGMHTIGVTWGFRSREELAGLKPDLLADQPEEITAYIREVTGRLSG